MHPSVNQHQHQFYIFLLISSFLFLFSFSFFPTITHAVNYTLSIYDQTTDHLVTQTLTKANSPYLFPNLCTTANVIERGSTLTIEPGVVVKFALPRWCTGNVFLVYGNLIAQGTETDPIIFTSFADDTVGGDTNCAG